jgi:hypothetical protein
MDRSKPCIETEITGGAGVEKDRFGKDNKSKKNNNRFI